MSQQETRRGKLRLVPNIEGEETYEKKAKEIVASLPVPEKEVDYIAGLFAEEGWEQALDEADYYARSGKGTPDYEILNGKIYEVLENVDLTEDGGFCEITKNPDGTLSFIASWYNGGASLSEVLEDELDSQEQ